ncbi:MAG TPA: insulinase family protein [Micromonosporaceae bacterium]
MIKETEVDGVPTVVAPTQGPMHAGLVFRVGRADETLARSGLTHLVEHLALHGHGLTDYHFNGATGPTVTHFHMSGSESAVVEFLTGVCTALANLPMHRLATEKEILRTEWSSRTSPANEQMPLWRYGARDYGLLSYEEWGVSSLTAEEVEWWARTWFTRENAVLWIAGDGVPAGLSLRLPSGARRPVPAASSALPVTPAYFVGPSKSIVFDAVVRRRTAASVFTGVLQRELFRDLRQEGGYSYTVDASYDPRDNQVAIVTALADALPEKQSAVLGGFVDVLARLKVGRIDKADVEAVVGQGDESLRHPEAEAARLASVAVNMLTGYPNRTLEELRDELRAVTVDDVHEVAVEASNSGLLMVPRGHCADWAGYAEAPCQSTDRIDGPAYPSREHDDVSLVIGQQGVGIVTATGGSTVRFDRCSAMLAWPDGARELIGHDAFVVRVEPTLWEVPPQALAILDAALPPHQVITMPARQPDAIPQPKPKPKPVTVSPARNGFEMTVLAVSGVAGGLAALFAIAVTITALTDPGLDAVIAIIFFWAVAAILGAPAAVVYRRRRKRKAGPA